MTYPLTPCHVAVSNITTERGTPLSTMGNAQLQQMKATLEHDVVPVVRAEVEAIEDVEEGGDASDELNCSMTLTPELLARQIRPKAPSMPRRQCLIS